MTRTFAFTVAGIPGPQGSKNNYGRGRTVESSKKVGPWREAVKCAALQTIGLRHGPERPWQPFDGPLSLTAVFWLPRPASAPKKRWAPSTRPDCSKLVRSTEDALTDVAVWVDDARVVRINASKSYVGGWFDPAILEYGLREPAHPGASLVISEVTP